MYSQRMVQKLSFCTSSRSLNDFSRKTATYYLTLLAKYKDWKNPFQKSSKFHIKGKPAHQGMSGAAFWTVCICMRPRELQTLYLWKQACLAFGNLSETRSVLEEPPD